METDEQTSAPRLNRDCFIHTDIKGRSNEKIIPFNEATWLKVQNATRARSNLLKSSKYDIVCRNLPSSLQPEHGYHKSCYSNFTAVPKMQLPQNVKSRRESGEKLLRSDIESTTAGASGIFKQGYVFSANRN